MERINAKDVQSMMEAYASVYKSEEQEVISEETQELEENRNQRGAAARANRQAAAADAAKRREEGLTVQGRPIRGQGNRELRPHSQRTNQQVSRLLPRKPGTAPTSSTSDTPVQKPRPQSPSSNLKPGNPNVVVSPKSGEETKFERRLPTSAELRAAQAARKAATAGGASKKEAEYQAVKAGVGVSKGTVKDPKIAADAARKAELQRIRSRSSSQTQAGVRPTVSSTADPKTPPAVPAAKPTAAAAAPAPVVKKKPAMGGRNRMRMEEVDVFDTIKEYLIGEGATEEEALKQMLTLTDEQRTEILEGSCGSKKKKKSRKGGY